MKTTANSTTPATRPCRVTAAHPTSTGAAPAAPPITMFCGVERLSHIV